MLTAHGPDHISFISKDSTIQADIPASRVADVTIPFTPFNNIRPFKKFNVVGWLASVEHVLWRHYGRVQYTSMDLSQATMEL
ncbi:hypothetical protein GPECTOR_30g230 [Gonium pectorale]|uniref:Uncharacterized protein n=1 Tax=Gonium pectorale TaxID=33097 RepID=A0A150GE74_GONPE|nr:hypothetical protein GPECTOR_30g230 [Gonium pectorale]|eukprot:KXZ48134.1 hypothetical protein GPECTOR_30g230 [Gonium pectorale]